MLRGVMIASFSSGCSHHHHRQIGSVGGRSLPHRGRILARLRLPVLLARRARAGVRSRGDDPGDERRPRHDVRTHGCHALRAVGTRICRYSGASLTYQLTSVVSGGVAPFIATVLLQTYGSSAVATYVAACSWSRSWRRGSCRRRTACRSTSPSSLRQRHVQAPWAISSGLGQVSECRSSRGRSGRSAALRERRERTYHRQTPVGRTTAIRAMSAVAAPAFLHRGANVTNAPVDVSTTCTATSPVRPRRWCGSETYSEDMGQSSWLTAPEWFRIRGRAWRSERSKECAGGRQWLRRARGVPGPGARVSRDGSGHQRARRAERCRARDEPGRR